MQAIVKPSVISGIVQAPPSKSLMQRALVAGFLSRTKTVIKNPGRSDDDNAVLEIIKNLGAGVEIEEVITIESNGLLPSSDILSAGESGLAARMLAPVAALSSKEITLTGKGSLLKRPVAELERVMKLLQVQVSSEKGFLPLKIKGPLVPANIEIDGSGSSQYLTGLLMAFSAAGAKNVSIDVKNLKSKPYIELTLQVMRDFGMKVPQNHNFHSFYFGDEDVMRRGQIEYAIEGDWSGAAFLLAAGAIAGDVTVNGVQSFSLQSDKLIMQALMQAGAVLSVEEKQVYIKRYKLKAFHFNAVDAPDLFPPLAALAAVCEGTSVMEGVHRLEHKESNRALSLVMELEKFGVDIKIQDDLLVIRGGNPLKGCRVFSHNDHRIAMACAILGLVAEGETIINGAGSVNKSYPDFFKHLELLGANVSLH